MNARDRTILSLPAYEFIDLQSASREGGERDILKSEGQCIHVSEITIRMKSFENNILA